MAGWLGGALLFSIYHEPDALYNSFIWTDMRGCLDNLWAHSSEAGASVINIFAAVIYVEYNSCMLYVLYASME